MTHTDSSLNTAHSRGLPGKVFWLGLGALLVAMACYAGSAHSFGGKGHGRMEARIEKMMDRLEVTDEQRSQIRSIMDGQRPAFRSLHDQMKTNRQAFHKLDPLASNYDAEVQRLAAEVAQASSGMMALIGDGRKQIWQVLNEEQREQANKAWEKHRARKSGKH